MYYFVVFNDWQWYIAEFEESPCPPTEKWQIYPANGTERNDAALLWAEFQLEQAGEWRRYIGDPKWVNQYITRANKALEKIKVLSCRSPKLRRITTPDGMLKFVRR